MSDIATQVKTLSVGDKIAGHYEVTEVLPVHLGRPEYTVKDSDDAGQPFVLSQVGKPTKETEADKVKRGLERAQRVASWIRTPGAVIPKDFLFDDGCLFSVSPNPAGVPVLQFIQEQTPPLSKLVSWINQLASVMEVFHDARQPQYLGRIPLENLRIAGDQIQLTGFDMNPDFKIEFRPESEEMPKAPDARLDARSDVWALGTLLQKLVDSSADEVKKSLRTENDLRSLLAMMVHQEPDKRVPNMATLKTRLERISWTKAPKLSNTGFSDAPIKVLTVEEKSPFAELIEAYRLWILIGVGAILAIIALLQFIFPPALDN